MRGGKTPMRHRRISLLLSALFFAAIVFIPFSNAISENPKADRTIVITIDDGPREWMLSKFLAFFRKERIPATFFILCWRIDGSDTEELVFGAHQDGHGIANHTYGHGNMVEFAKRKGVNWVLNDVKRCSRIIKNIVGYSPRFFRPPYWAINEEIHQRLTAQNYTVQTLDHPSLSIEERGKRDVNTTDYLFHDRYLRDPTGATTALVHEIRKIIAAREQGGIFTHVLDIHEIPVGLAALEILVPEWRAKGYQFQTLPWIYGIKGYGK